MFYGACLSTRALKPCLKRNQAISFSTIITNSQWISSPLTVLPLCISLRQTQQAHAISLLSGFLPTSVSISASLILCYATSGNPSTSRILFQQNLPYSRSAFLWNTITRAYTIAGVYDGFETYNLMIRTGVKPDDHTFPFVLKVCSDYSEVRKGKEVHGLVFKLGFDSDVFVENTLMQLYGGCGEITDAHKLFDEMSERDVVSWNTFIGILSVRLEYAEAIGVFRRMMRELRPDDVSLVTVLPVSSGVEDEVMTMEVHGYAVKMGLDSQVKIGNALVDAYGKCGNLKASKRVFDEIVVRNDVSWNAMITGLAHTGHHREALEFFRLMTDTGMKPNPVAVSSMLPILVELGCLPYGKQLHGYNVRTGMESDIFVANSLLDMYAKFRYSALALNVFNKIDEKNVVSWNAMVANYAQNKLEPEALELVRQMRAYGGNLNSVTLANVLPACARMGFLHIGKEIHAFAIRIGSALELFVSNALTDMYAKCGRLDLARNVFTISHRDDISYNTLIVAYAETGKCQESLSLFAEMWLTGFEHDAISFVGALSACANTASIKQGKEIHGISVRKMLDMHILVANSLLDLYSKCGRMDVAKKMFNLMPKRDIASWNTIILGYGMLGEVDTAINLFEAMKEDGAVKCDSISYIAVLSACGHGGLVEKGREYFKEIFEQNIQPTQTHYACMVDLFGRAGLMEEAVEVINSLSVEAEANIWGSLLGACRLHGNIELGRWAAEHLFELQPANSGYYMLLSNMYAEAGRWTEAVEVRELMKSRRIEKNPGCSWVQNHDLKHGFPNREK